MSKNDLPYAADVEVPISYDELEVLRSQYKKEQAAQSQVTVQTKFLYAWGLVKSPKTYEQEEGVQLLQEVYREDASRRRDCLYYLAVGYYKMKNYEQSRKFIALLLEKEPTNMQARSLELLVDKAIARDGYIGIALVGGIAAVGALLIANVFRKTRK